MKSLIETVREIKDYSKNKADFSVSTLDFAKGLQPKSRELFVVNLNGSEYRVAPEVTNEFVKRIDGDTSIMRHPHVSPQVKQGYLIDLATAMGEKEIVLRSNNNVVDGLVSPRYKALDNDLVADSLLQIGVEGMYTTITRVDSRNINLRVISPDRWNFIAPHNTMYYGGVSIKNSELLGVGFSVNTMIANVSCFNTTLATNMINVNSLTGSRDQILEALLLAFANISEFARIMFEQMEYARGIEFSNPIAVFTKIARELKLNQKVQDSIEAYWTREGRSNSLFDVVQAVTWGSQRYTDDGNRMIPARQLEVRDAAERNIWDLTLQLLDADAKGEDADQYMLDMQLVPKSSVLRIMADESEKKAVIDLPVSYFASV